MVNPDTYKDFFISYTSVDRLWAEWIAWQLEEAGYTTVIQAWDFQPGNNFVLDMNTATRTSKRTVVVLSPDYFNSGFTPSEWAAAFRQDPKSEYGLLLPVRVRSCNVEGLLGQIVFIDLVGQDEQTAHTALLAGVQNQRRKPISPPAFPTFPYASIEHPAFPAALPLIWNIPYARNPFFTSREEVLTQLDTTLRSGLVTTLARLQVISGLGGIGKTQVAVEYAYRYHGDYQAVLWTRADSHEALSANFITIARLLNLPEKDEQAPLVVVEAVKEWLKTHSQWLLILDNANDLTLMKEFIPPAFGGHILLTTRVQVMGGLAQSIELEGMEPEIGALFLLRRAGIIAHSTLVKNLPPADMTLAKEISQQMGGLPLALDQAGAYIEEVACGLLEYSRRYQQHRAILLQRRGGLVGDHPESVVTTWSLSFGKIERTNAAAADLLRLCAFLDPDIIPTEIIVHGAPCLSAWLRSVVENSFALDEAIGVLRIYSLIRHNVANHTFSIHRLLQAVLVDEMDQETQQQWATYAAQAIITAFNSLKRASSTRLALLENQVGTCIDLSKRYGVETDKVNQLMRDILRDAFGELPIKSFPYESSSSVWRIINHILLLSKRELRVGYLLYYCSLKPRELVRYLPQEFNDVDEIYRVSRNILERLNRWLEQ